MTTRSLDESPLPTAQPGDRLLCPIDPAGGPEAVAGATESGQRDQPPQCDRCGSTMSYLGEIPPGRLSQGKLVFRCYTCNRVISLPPS
jgi:hypothetical protein